MIKDYVRFAFSTFKARKIRSWLTMIGIFIGIVTVVALISLGQGLQASINEQFELMGIDKIMITPGTGFFGMTGVGEEQELREDDLDVIKKTKGIKLAGGMIYKIGKVKYGDEVRYTWVTGLPVDESRRVIEDMQSFKIDKGRDLEQGDKYKVIITTLIARGIFFKDQPVSVGDKIEIEGKDFRVVGSLEPIGNPQDDSSLMIPMDTAREVLKESERFDVVIAQAQPGFDVNVVAERMKKDLREHRDLEEGEEDFAVSTSEQMMEAFGVVFTIVQIVLISIAGISLLVGGVGITNTMYTAVLERTRDIGIMKAIGAKNSDIMNIFLIESGMLGLAGGAIGIIVGILLSKAVVFIAAQAGIGMIKAYFPWYLIVGALAFSFLAGTLSGVLPARQAALQEPVDALRYE